MPSVDVTFISLFAAKPDNYHRAKLAAVKAPHSGDWLNAPPIISRDLCMEDNAIRVAVGLELGANLCKPINAHVVIKTVGHFMCVYLCYTLYEHK